MRVFLLAVFLLGCAWAQTPTSQSQLAVCGGTVTTNCVPKADANGNVSVAFSGPLDRLRSLRIQQRPTSGTNLGLGQL